MVSLNTWLKMEALGAEVFDIIENQTTHVRFHVRYKEPLPSPESQKKIDNMRKHRSIPKAELNFVGSSYHG